MTARLIVDLDAFAANLSLVRERIAPAHHMLVVKDDAYGHGLLPIVRRAHAEGVRWFGAFDTGTGRAVRDVLGPDARIFVWMLESQADLAAAVDADLDVGVGNALLLEDFAALGTRPEGALRPRVHLKVDTGLHRNGIRPEEWPDAVARAAELERAGVLGVEGVWSHIAEASDAEDDAARALFLHARETLAAAGLRPGYAHLAASAAGFTRPEFREDLVRIGAFAYGIAPAGGPDAEALGIVPIASLRAHVIGTDGTHAHVGVGSLDGIPSPLGGMLSVRTPAGVRRVVTVRPDRLIVEGWDGMTAGDEVVVLGAGGLHSATELAERIATIGEEIAVRISPRIERIYPGAPVG
ncbi:alanine racemase [Microbacterium sp. dk485]|uniref:alanine racemase n=1 Tax=Microbacterium sp. dk485 TaxID=2560021 RepID=UPI001073AAB5|nr:alanine racemase [Microbacterium sp. dk485]TFV82125.1 alanine racemase [Microbacterium sp. dk485]